MVDVSKYSPRYGGLIKDDGTVINEADLMTGDGLFTRPLYAGGYQFVADTHTRLHAGQMFCASTLIASLDNDAAFDVVVTSGATVATHIVFDPALGGTYHIHVYETPTFTGGTGMTAHNQKLGSTNTLDATIVHSPTVTDVGTLRRVFEVPGGSGGKAVGASADFGSEIYIPAAGKVLFRMTNKSGQARTGSAVLCGYNTSPIPDA